MAEAKYIAAFGAQPAFLNITNEDGKVRVHVRQASINGLTPGPQAFVDFTTAEFKGLVRKVLSNA